MPVKYQNFDFSYLKDGKRIFVQSERSKRHGLALKEEVESALDFDPFVFHMRDGGHVAALHSHRSKTYFSRIDIARFFYSTGRNRVIRALSELGIESAVRKGKWSTVKNPYDGPSYSLPYGFVQSPVLATAVLMLSSVGAYLRQLPNEITCSVYMDDIALSSNSIQALSDAFSDLKRILSDANYTINPSKTREPAENIDIFNCRLSSGHASVCESRVLEFYSVPRTAASEEGFARYMASVTAGNDEGAQE